MVDNHETYNVDNDRKPAAAVPLTLTTTLPPLSVGGATATSGAGGGGGGGGGARLSLLAERVKRNAMFQPRMPKGKRGRHNEAKVAAKAAMEERTPIGRSRRRKFNHRIQKQMKEVTCCREKQRHEKCLECIALMPPSSPRQCPDAPTCSNR